MVLRNRWSPCILAKLRECITINVGANEHYTFAIITLFILYIFVKFSEASIRGILIGSYGVFGGLGGTIMIFLFNHLELRQVTLVCMLMPILFLFLVFIVSVILSSHRRCVLLSYVPPI